MASVVTKISVSSSKVMFRARLNEDCQYNELYWAVMLCRTIWALLSLLKQIVLVWWFLSWQGGLCCWQILGISGRWFGTWKGKDANNYFILSNFHAPVLETLVVVKPVKKFQTSVSQSQQLSTGPRLHPNAVYNPPPSHSEIIFPIVLLFVCRYSKGTCLSKFSDQIFM